MPAHDTGPFVKVRFVRANVGETVGMIVPAVRFDAMSVSEVSRLFPHFEARKMQFMEVSSTFAEWEECFVWREWDGGDVRRVRVNP